MTTGRGKVTGNTVFHLQMTCLGSVLVADRPVPDIFSVEDCR